MRIDLSIPQLDALEAAAAGYLTRPDQRHEHWRIDTGTGRHVAVTSTARTLMAKLLIEEDVAAAGVIRACITDHGVQVLREYDSRGGTSVTLWAIHGAALAAASLDGLERHEHTGRWTINDGTGDNHADRAGAYLLLRRLITVGESDGNIRLGRLTPRGEIAYAACAKRLADDKAAGR